MKWLRELVSSYTVWFLLGLALVLRLPQLNGSFWLDEAAQALEVIRPWYLQLEIAGDFQPPLLHLLLHLVAYVSQSEWWLRVWGALIPGLITIYYSYKVAERLFNKKTAVISGLLIATSSFHIFYSQEIRPYSLSAALTAYSWFILVETFFKEKGFTKRSILQYGVVTGLGLYSTYLYPFVVISQLGYVLWKERQQLLKYLFSTSIGGLLFLPWLPFFYEQLQVGQALRKTLPGWEDVVSIPQLKSVPITVAKFMFGVIDVEISAIFILLTLVFATALGITCVQIWQKNNKYLTSKAVAVVLTWLVVPLLTAWLVSFMIPVVQPKRVVYLLPAFYILVTALVVELQRQKLPILQRLFKYFSKTKENFLNSTLLLTVTTLGLLFALNIFSTLQYYFNPIYQRENWKQMQQMITTQYPSNAAVVFAFNTAFAPWEWYDDTSYPVFAVGNLTQAEVIAVETKLKKATEYPYLLVFDYLRDLSDPDRKIEAALENLGYTERGAVSLPGIGFVRIFAREEGVLS